MTFCLETPPFIAPCSVHRRCTESGPHIRLSDRCPLARHRERRDIFAKGEIPGTQHVSCFFWTCYARSTPGTARQRRNSGNEVHLDRRGRRSLQFFSKILRSALKCAIIHLMQASNGRKAVEAWSGFLTRSNQGK